MKNKKLTFFLSVALLAGCVPVMSLFPLYTDETSVFEEKLLGTWVDDPNEPETTWVFQRPDEQENETKNTYNLTLIGEDGKNAGSFNVNLVKIKDKLFLNAYPNKLPCKEQDPEKMEWPFNASFMVVVHAFAKIDSIEPQLKMWLTDDEEMKKLLEEDPNAIEHVTIEDKLILTAPTKELQAFVLKYADDERVFSEEIVLTRKKTEDPNEPNDTDSSKNSK